jgi:adenylosuccinate synthase
VVAVRVAGPNAGHTVIGRCPQGCAQLPEDHHLPEGRTFPAFGYGHRWKLRSVPVAAVSNDDAMLVIAAGSEVDLGVLDHEVDQLDLAGYDVSGRLVVDRSATVLTGEHIKIEQDSDLVKRLGSTAKGIGAARADRVWRTADLVGSTIGGADTVPLIYNWLREGATVLVEGTQGYGLGQHAGSYPQCTSSDCRAIDFLAMAGLSPWHDAVDEFQVWLAARVRPIRVAGNSGPLKGETTWDALGLPEERTTVTNKVRRVGEWDPDMVRDALEANGGKSVNIALTMVDSVVPGAADQSSWSAIDRYSQRQIIDLTSKVMGETNGVVKFIGTGPATGIFL